MFSAFVLAAVGFPMDGAVQADPAQTVAPGKRGEVSVTILGSVERDMPLLVRLRSSGVTLPENRLDWDDVVDPQAQQPRVRAKFVAPRSAGTYAVEAWVSYVTCDAEHCRPRYAELSLSITVAAG